MTTQKIFTAEEAQKKFEALPDEVKDLLYSPEKTSIIQKVGEKNKLHFDQMGRLDIETTNVLLGFTDMKDFASILMKGLEIDQASVDAITKDMDEMLFSKIRGAMKTAYVQATTPPVVPMSQPAAMSAAPAMEKKSVVMPSSVAKATAPATPAPGSVAPAPVVPKPPVTPSVPLSNQITAPAVKPSITTPEADVMFNEPTVSLPKKVEPPKPGPSYKADPYREPLD